MASELKTLEDLKFEVGGYEWEAWRNNKEIDCDGKVIMIKDLRKETIKWIKEEISIRMNGQLKISLLDENKIQDFACKIIYSDEIKRWLDRFNLTIGDLK